MNETLIFFKIVPLAINTFISVRFLLVDAPQKLLYAFWTVAYFEEKHQIVQV